MPTRGVIGNESGTLSPLLKALLDGFIAYLRAVNRTDDTIKLYTTIISQYLIHVNFVEDVYTRRSVESYLAKLRMENAGGATLRNRFYCLKTFFVASDHGAIWTFRKTDVPQLPSKQYRPMITEDEMQRMEQVAKSQRHSSPGNLVTHNGRTWSTKVKDGRWLGIRNLAIIRVGDALGPRRIELFTLNVSDLHLTPESEYEATALAALTASQRATLNRIYQPHLHLQTAKHGEFVSRDLDPETVKILRDYLATRIKGSKIKGGVEIVNGVEVNALFVANKFGDRLSRKALSQIQSGIRKEAGINKKRAGFHAARRGRVTSIHNAGVQNPEITAEWGWKSKNTVDTYIIPDLAKVKEQVKEAHPFFKEKKA